MSAEKVFEILVRDHARALRAFLLGIVRDPNRADDLFQEVLVAAWKSLPRFEVGRPFAPWLRKIAIRKLIDWRRSPASRRMVFCDEETLAAIEDRFARLDGVTGDTWEGKTEALRACLEGLDEEDRRVLDLRYESALSCEGISETLGQSVEWVKKRLQRARGKLALCVEGRVGT